MVKSLQRKKLLQQMVGSMSLKIYQQLIDEGKAHKYEVKEQPVSGYQSHVKGYDITNIKIQEATEVEDPSKEETIEELGDSIKTGKHQKETEEPNELEKPEVTDKPEIWGETRRRAS